MIFLIENNEKRAKAERKNLKHFLREDSTALLEFDQTTERYVVAFMVAK